MFSFLMELTFGAIAVVKGRRLLVERLDENFSNNPENFPNDNNHSGWPALAAIFAFLFVTFAVFTAAIFPFWLFLPIFLAAGWLCWAVGNLGSWRRLEPGNPLRQALDSVLSLNGRQPSKVRLRRSAARSPRFTLDGALEIPSAFVRSVPFDEQCYLYQVIRNRQRRGVDRKVVSIIFQVTLALALSGLAIVFLRFPSWFLYLLLPLFQMMLKDFSKRNQFTEEEFQVALTQTNDLDSAERALSRILPKGDSIEAIFKLREWWAMQSPANPTVAAMQSASISATQNVGLGP